MNHKWPTFSLKVIGELLQEVSLRPTFVRPISESGSVEKDFLIYGWATFRISTHWTLRFARKVIVLGYDDRWSHFLASRDVRQSFGSTCAKVAHISGAEEILVLPEGTILEDSICEDINVGEVKKRAMTLWGPPDLEISQIYTEKEINQMGQDRIHYFSLQPNDFLI